MRNIFVEKSYTKSVQVEDYQNNQNLSADHLLLPPCLVFCMIFEEKCF